MASHLILCTCPDSATATRIAETLVDQELAACVNIIPGLRSIYRWQGRLEEAEECLLLIKAPLAHYARVEAAILGLHPYELPEIIAVSIDAGLPAYLAWLASAGGVP